VCQASLTGILKTKLGEWTINPNKENNYKALLHKSKMAIMIKTKDNKWQKCEYSHTCRSNIHCINRIKGNTEEDIFLEQQSYIPVEYDTTTKLLIVRIRNYAITTNLHNSTEIYQQKDKNTLTIFEEYTGI
jgi:hypothetical protein